MANKVDNNKEAIDKKTQKLLENNISLSFKEKVDINRCLFGTTQHFYFTKKISGFVGNDETRSSVYDNGKGLIDATTVNQKKKASEISTTMRSITEDEAVGGVCLLQSEADLDALECMVENATLRQAQEEEDEQQQQALEEEEGVVDDDGAATTATEKKDEKEENVIKNCEYYDAMARLGPSMNMVENKLHDIRSLSSARRLINGEHDYSAKVVLKGEEASDPKLKSELESQRNHVIELRKLRRLASQGIPDKGSRRAVTWRVLLGYLPVELSEWEDVLEKERDLYRKLVFELFVHPSHQQSQEVLQPPPPQDGFHVQAPSGELIDGSSLRNRVDLSKLRGLSRLNAASIKECNSRLNVEAMTKDDDMDFSTDSLDFTEKGDEKGNSNELGSSFSTVTDNPLSVDDNSKWAEFFENANSLDEIRKDVVRTHPDLHFFLEPERDLGKRRYAALERILFVWAKLNQGVKYVQGMNEIVGTIYFVIATDFNEEWACEAEADTYFLFNLLMDDMRDIFIPDLDDADTGIQGRIAYFKSLLSLHDPEVRCHLDDLGIDASFFAVRWLTTLLSREFLLPDTIRLWDSMFASTHKDNFLRYVCVTMVMFIRDRLLQSDFSASLRLLQSYPPTDVGTLLETSRALWIYESQVTLACQRGGITLKQALNAISPPANLVMAYGLMGGLSPSAKKRSSKKSSSSNSTIQESTLGTMTSTTQHFFNGLFRNQQQPQASGNNNIVKHSSSPSLSASFSCSTTIANTTSTAKEVDSLNLSSSSTYLQRMREEKKKWFKTSS